MKRKLITIAIAAMTAVTSGYVLYRRAHSDAAPAYRTAAVQRGDIEATVAATGTLGAVTTVQVGTQVSGQISAIYADFNSKVKKGQLIARIDPTLQQQAVADAQAGVERTAQVQAASAVVSAIYGLIFQQALMSYYTGELDPAHVMLNG